MTDIGDVRGVDEWDRAYVITGAPNLWGEPPVPYVENLAGQLAALDGPILELPCGDGRNTIPLASAGAWVMGADSSRRALGLAAKRLAALGLSRVTLLESNVFGTPFLDEQFAAVVCWDLLGHLRRPDRALDELVRICRPGGLIAANVFSLGDDTRGEDMVAIGPNEYLYQDRLYFHYYDKTSVSTLITGVAHARLVALERTRWTEPAHQGYREYEHDHESWAFVLEVAE